MQCAVRAPGSEVCTVAFVYYYYYYYEDICGWIILGWILERWDGVMWTGLVWLRIGTGGELL
jgi:hypothetical protein